MRVKRYYLSMAPEDEPQDEDLAGEAGGDGQNGDPPNPPCDETNPNYPDC